MYVYVNVIRTWFLKLCFCVILEPHYRQMGVDGDDLDQDRIVRENRFVS